MTFYIDTKKESSAREISHQLGKCVRRHCRHWSELVFLCIGSDRVTGDCLGPYIGHQLSRQELKNIFIYGTLKQPVHALNLEQMIRHIKKYHPDALVIAIDASLGQKKHLGYVTIVARDIAALEQLTLQTTRLSTVVSVADVITEGILDYTKAFTC